jgi:hypothetical protein
MKTVAFVSALAAASGLVNATPTKTTEQKANKRATIPTVTPSGNGMSNYTVRSDGTRWRPLSGHRANKHAQLSSPAARVSTSVVSITSPAAPRALSTPSPMRRSACGTSPSSRT